MHDPVQGLPGTFPGHQNAHLLVRQARFAGLGAVPEESALELAGALLGFQRIGLVRFGNALQHRRTVIFDAFQERCRQRSVVLRCTPSVAAA